jgi:hypothetical protein
VRERLKLLQRGRPYIKSHRTLVFVGDARCFAFIVDARGDEAVGVEKATGVSIPKWSRQLLN